MNEENGDPRIALFDMDGSLADYVGSLQRDLETLRAPSEPPLPENLWDLEKSQRGIRFCPLVERSGYPVMPEALQRIVDLQFHACQRAEWKRVVDETANLEEFINGKARRPKGALALG